MDSMGQRLPWLVAMMLAGVSTAHAAAPAATAAGSPEASATTEPAAPPLQTPTPTPDASTLEASTPAPTAAAATTTAAPVPSTAPASTAPASASEPVAARSSSPDPATTPPEASPAPARPPRTYPRLVLAGGPVVGPHALGNEECNAEAGRCETKGSFIGMGAQLEARARLWRMIYAHARGLVVGNVSPNDRIHRGLWGLGAGMGLHGRRAFARAEYLFLDTFGDNHFEPPFYDGEVASDEWGHHAGMLSVGFRQPLPKRVYAELWGGLVVGPHSTRRVPDLEPDARVLTTFLVGLNVSWDAWP